MRERIAAHRTLAWAGAGAATVVVGAAAWVVGRGHDFGEDFCGDLAHVEDRLTSGRYARLGDLVDDLRSMDAPAAAREAFGGVVGGYERLARLEEGEPPAGGEDLAEEAATFSDASDDLAAYAGSACHLDIEDGLGASGGASSGATPSTAAAGGPDAGPGEGPAG
jgi:hypothetical protein